MPFVNVQLIVDDYRALGIDLPAEAEAAVDTWTALSEAAAAKPGNALHAEMADGSLGAANAGQRLRDVALTLALRDAMQGLVRDLDRPATARARAAFAADADRVVAELHPRFDTAAATVVEGLGHFSPSEYADPGRLLAERPGAAERYHPTRQAAGVLDLIARLINSVRPIATPAAGYIGLTGEAGADTLAAAQSAYATGSPQRWVSLFAVAGVKPALNTTDEAQAVATKSADLGRTRDAETTERSVRRARKEEPWFVS